MAERKKYTGKDIKVLQNVQHIQQIPTMYIADTEAAGAFQLFKELLDNAIDEYLAGHVTKISVEYHKGVITVQDNGRGIPTEKHSKTGLSTLTTIFTIAGAGGKFKGGDYSGTYSNSVGLHGVGVTAVTALSEVLEVWTRYNKKTYYQKFENGVPVAKIKVVKKKLKGTKISFNLNKKFFSTFTVNKKDVQERLNELSYICSGLVLTYTDSKSTVTYGNTTGTYLEDTGKQFLHKPIVVKTDNMYFEFAWASSDDTNIKVYVNTSPVFSGTPFTYIKKAVTSFFDDKTGKNLKNELLYGLHVFSYMSVALPKFQGQTKHKLMNTNIKKDIDNAFSPALLKFQVLEKDLYSELINHALENIKGDVVQNNLTIPLKYGEYFTKLLITLLIIFTIDPIYFLWKYPEIGMMKYYFYFVGVVYVIFLFLLWKAKTKVDYIILHNITKLIIVVGVLSLMLIDTSVIIQRILNAKI